MAASRVEFRVGIADLQGYACGLLRAAAAKGARLVVRADAEAISGLDDRLWTFSQLDFLPHCRAGDPLEARCPVVLTAADDLADLGGRDCLVNLASTPVTGCEAMARVIELVGSAEADKAAGRRRWRAWRDAGVQPTTMEVT